MPTTVIAMYDNADKARQVAQDLVQAGFNQDAIELLNGGPEATESVVEKLIGRGIDKSEAVVYANVLRRGSALVTLEAENETAEDALDIMERHGPRDLDQLTAELRSEQRRPAGEIVAEGEATVPVIEEKVSIGKRQVLRGGLRVRSTVTERPVEESVRLREETVVVDRQPTDRVLTPEEREQAFQRKTIEMTETAEEVVVSKEARVVGEVALRKIATEHEEKVHATARRTDVEVEEIEPKAETPVSR